MAQGDVTFFEETWKHMHDLMDMGNAGDTFKMFLVVTGTTPSASDAVPAYTGGTTNYGTVGNAEVATGGTYSAGGEAVTVNLTEVGGTVTWDTTNDVSWAQNASNPTDALYAMIYDDTTTIKHALCWIDIGGAFDMTTGDLQVNTNASGWWSES